MILVRYGELYLKSRPVKRKFQNTLSWNIRTMLKKERIKAAVHNQYGRILVDGPPAKLNPILRRTFGIVSFSPAKTCDTNQDTIQNEISKIKLKPNSTFALRVTRPYKEFPKNSQELERELGQIVNDNNKTAKVNLTSPDTTIELEIRKDHTYLFTKRIPGPGGLPIGTGGKCLSLISSPSSFKSTYLLMKRGVTPTCAYTDKKYLPIITRLERYSPSPLQKTKVKNLAAATTKAKSLNLPALIVPDKKPIAAGLLILQPLIGQ